MGLEPMTSPLTGALSHLSYSRSDFEKELLLIHTVIVAATYSPHFVVSTIGATAFYFRVRNGTG